jgi:osmoprotectant transport system permease protein
MNERIADAFQLLPDYLSQHVLLSAAALAFGIGIGLPLALLATRRARLRWPLVAVASLVQTIPGLALLALFYPLLLGLSRLTEPFLGFGIPALGFLPSVLALTLYAVLPILRNAVAGLTSVDKDVIEAANAVGMTARQRLFRVEVPLAAPVIMAGIRTAAVITVGAATLAAFVGAGGLGEPIVTGLSLADTRMVLSGAIPAALLALAVDGGLAIVEHRISPAHLRERN